MSITRKARGIVSSLVILAAAGTLGFYFLRKENQADQDKYRTEQVSRGDVSMTVVATGSISAVKTVQVGSQVSGIIARLHADFNSRVTKGQLLVELDPTPFEAITAQRRADLAGAEVQHRNNGVTFERMKRLLQEDLVAESEYDAAKAAVEASEATVQQARAALSQSEANLSYTKIRSPIDGVVVDRQYDIGQTVAASFQAPTLFTIAQDLKQTQVQADVDQSDIGRVRVGQTARFTVDAYPGESFQGKVTQVRLNATVNQNVITYPVIVEVPNPEEKLRPKMTADTSIEVATVTDVLRIPNAALRFRPTDVNGAGGKGAALRAGGGGDTRGGRGVRSDGEAGSPGEASRGRAVRTPSASGEGGFGGAARALETGRSQAGKSKPSQQIYVLTDGGELRPVAIRTGITDGRHTQVLEGDLDPRDRVVIGLVTVRAEAAGTSPFGGGGGGPGGPGGGRRGGF